METAGALISARPTGVASIAALGADSIKLFKGARWTNRCTQPLLNHEFIERKIITLCMAGIAAICRLRARLAHWAALETDSVCAEESFFALGQALSFTPSESIFTLGAELAAKTAC